MPPHIVLIMADDMGYECIGVNGATEYQTPHIDQLAESGIRFTQAFSTPIYTPTRVQLMTGQYNFQNYSHFGYLSPQQTTFAHRLKQAGYRTCIAGKWQLNGLYHQLPGHQDRARPQAMGFDESCLWQVTQARDQGERFADPLIETNGRLKRHAGAYGPDIFCDFICDFIRRNKHEPMLCYYPMVLVHDPFVPTPDSPQWLTSERKRRDNRFFADMMAYTDKLVAKILRTLEEEQIAEQTLLIFTADNGTHRSITTMTHSGPVQGGKALTIDAGIHVPLFAHWKGTIPGGLQCDDLIDFTDIQPTLLEVAEQANSPSSDGRSFLPQLLGKPGTPRENIFCHYDPRWGPRRDAPARFVRDHRYKLYHDGRFFDVRHDPLEQSPLVENLSERATQSKRQLQSSLNQWPAWSPSKRPAP